MKRATQHSNHAIPLIDQEACRNTEFLTNVALVLGHVLKPPHIEWIRICLEWRSNKAL